jgi:hypothetical protein
MIDVPAKLTKNSSLILKFKFPSSTLISFNFVESKAPDPTLITVAGIQIDESDEQLENACRSIRESLEPDSNVTLERARHSWKHFSQTTSTDDGMQIDETDEHSENACFSIRASLELASNVTLESALQL